MSSRRRRLATASVPLAVDSPRRRRLAATSVPLGRVQAGSPAQAVSAVNGRDAKVELFSARVTSVEVAQRSLVGDASRALRYIIRQAQLENRVQDASLAVLRGDVAQGALQVRAHSVEARGAMEVLYTNMKGELDNSQAVVRE